MLKIKLNALNPKTFWNKYDRFLILSHQTISLAASERWKCFGDWNNFISSELLQNIQSFQHSWTIMIIFQGSQQ